MLESVTATNLAGGDTDIPYQSSSETLFLLMLVVLIQIKFFSGLVLNSSGLM